MPPKVELVTIKQLPWINWGNVYTVTDLLTNNKYYIVGEHNNQRHADYVCASRADTEIKLRTAGGSFKDNWAARPIILTIGDRHFAASTHNAVHAPDMPRWRKPADIGHSGHFCVWVLEATTGGSEAYRNNMLQAVHLAQRLSVQFVEKGDNEVYSQMKIQFGNDPVKEIPSVLKDDWNHPQFRPLMDLMGYEIVYDDKTKVTTIIPKKVS